MVVLEGMLRGAAVAAAEVGGPAEILTHQHNGLLFAPRDVTALSDAIVRLARDDTLRQRLGRAAATDVREQWLWPRILSRLQAVYDETCHAQCSPIV
jgi:glycosyltransferase involved in cell wall biosynthesis